MLIVQPIRNKFLASSTWFTQFSRVWLPLHLLLRVLIGSLSHLNRLSLVRNKTKSNSLCVFSRVCHRFQDFPRFAPITWFCFGFWLAYRVTCCCCDWHYVIIQYFCTFLSLFLADSRRPLSDTFASGVSYSRSASAQDTPSSKQPLRKTTSDAAAVNDPVWKRASGTPLSRQVSGDGSKPKPLPKQLSKGVSNLIVWNSIPVWLQKTRWHATCP